MSETDNILPCPKCKGVAELYQEDKGQWRIDCDSNWRVCDFYLASTDKFLIRKVWNELDRG